MNLAVRIETAADIDAVQRAMAQAKQAGFAAVEMQMTDAGFLTPISSEAACRSLAACAARAESGISAVTVELPDYGSLSAPGKPFPSQAYQLVTAAMDRAEWLGAASLILPTAWLGTSSSQDDGYEDVSVRVEKSLRELRFEAQKRAVHLACDVATDGFLVSPLEARRLIDRVNSPWVGLSLDLGRLGTLGGAADWIALSGWRLACVGWGDDWETAADEADWIKITAALREAEYDGYVIYRGRGDWAGVARRERVAVDQTSP